MVLQRQVDVGMVQQQLGKPLISSTDSPKDWCSILVVRLIDVGPATCEELLSDAHVALVHSQPQCSPPSLIFMVDFGIGSLQEHLNNRLGSMCNSTHECRLLLTNIIDICMRLFEKAFCHIPPVILCCPVQQRAVFILSLKPVDYRKEEFEVESFGKG